MVNNVWNEMFANKKYLQHLGQLKKKNDMAKKNPSRLYSIIHIRNENMNFDTNAWKIDGRFILRFVRRQLISKLTRENVLLSKI